MIKILIFMQSLGGGGAERTIVNIINNLDRAKFDVVLVLGTDKNNDYLDLINGDARIEFLDTNNLKYGILKLTKIINKENPDLLFSTINIFNIATLIAKLLTFKKIPTVVREANNRTQSGKVTKFNKLLTTLLYNLCASKVIALSKGVKEDLINNFNISRKKIEVIYNPVDIEGINKLSKEPISNPIRKQDEKVLIAVGRLVEQKDYVTLLKAFNIVSSKLNSRLIILGKGPLELELKTLCQELNIENKVDFIGFKKNPYKYMAKADAFVLSSKWEGFGHVVVEAMATGTPVISTNCNSGPPEIIDKNKYGLLVPVGNYEDLADKIIELLSNNNLSEMYSDKGRERAEDFNARSIIKQYEKLFQDLVNN